MSSNDNRIYHAYRSARLNIRSFVGQYPLIYGLYQKTLRTPRSRLLAVPGTQVCIEGPPGSANSFFVNGFLMANPDTRVAHHHHVAAQIKRSVSYGVPVLAILRHPVECAVSRGAREPWRQTAAYRQWIRFFQAVKELRESVLIASFETVTSHPGDVVRAFNTRFDTGFNDNFPEPGEIFLKMDRGYARTLGVDPTSVISPNRPDPEKELLKQKARPCAVNHRLSVPALAIYEVLKQHAL